MHYGAKKWPQEVKYLGEYCRKGQNYYSGGELLDEIAENCPKSEKIRLTIYSKIVYISDQKWYLKIKYLGENF